jgi:hypothetical protein
MLYLSWSVHPGGPPSSDFRRRSELWRDETARQGGVALSGYFSRAPVRNQCLRAIFEVVAVQSSVRRRAVRAESVSSGRGRVALGGLDPSHQASQPVPAVPGHLGLE